MAYAGAKYVKNKDYLCAVRKLCLIPISLLLRGQLQELGAFGDNISKPGCLLENTAASNGYLELTGVFVFTNFTKLNRITLPTTKP